MLDMPILKFDKSIKYLESQISIQKNNKQLILDIISNIGLILNNSSEANNKNLQSVLDTANDFLQNISNNITTLEQLNLEISNITADLNDIVSSQSKPTKTKEYYIAAFSNIKNNIVQYTKNFQEVESKLDFDNTAFNDFINDNDFKYTFNTVDNQAENTYELASFSINNESTSISAGIEVQEQEISDDDIIDNGLEEAMAIKEQDSAEEAPVVEETTSVEETPVVKNETEVVDETPASAEVVEEAPTPEEISDVETIEENIEEAVEQKVVEEAPTTEEISDVETIEENIEEVVEQDIVEEAPIVEETPVVESETEVVEQDIVEEAPVVEETPVVEEVPVENASSASSPVDELADIFKNILVSLYDNKISESEFNAALTDLKAHLPSYNQQTVAENETEIVEQDIVEEETIVEDEAPIIEETPVVEDETEVVEQDIVNEETIEEIVEQDIIDEITVSDLESIIENVSDIVVEDETPIVEETIIADETEIAEQDIVEEAPIVEETPVVENETEIVEQDIVDELLISEDISDTNSNLNILLNDLFEEDDSTQEENEAEESIIEDSIISVENQQAQVQNRHHSIEEMIKKIESAEDKNKILLISEKTNKIYLPYRITELENYMKYYPNAYKSLSDVVEQEFIINLDTFTKHPSKSRFSETYNLVRNRSGKSILKAISYALKLKNKGNIDPAIIAACKNEYELHCYLYCLEQNKINSFKFFNIIYDVNLF